MSSDREAAWLGDIVEFADDAISYIDNRTVEELAVDRKSVAAIERCLQCLTEAAIRIGAERLAIIAPGVSMHDLRGLGNRLRHAYDDIDLSIIHRTVVDDLPALRAACLAALAR